MVAAVSANAIIDDSTPDCDAKNMLRLQGVGAKLTGRGRHTSFGDIHLLPQVLDAAGRFQTAPADAAMRVTADRLRLAPLFTAERTGP